MKPSNYTLSKMISIIFLLLSVVVFLGFSCHIKIIIIIIIIIYLIYITHTLNTMFFNNSQMEQSNRHCSQSHIQYTHMNSYRCRWIDCYWDQLDTYSWNWNSFKKEKKRNKFVLSDPMIFFVVKIFIFMFIVLTNFHNYIYKLKIIVIITEKKKYEKVRKL